MKKRQIMVHRVFVLIFSLIIQFCPLNLFIVFADSVKTIISPDTSIYSDVYVHEFAGGIGKLQALGENGYKSGLIDEDGNIITPIEYDYIDNFSEGIAIIYKDSLWGCIDNTGKIVVPIEYDYVDDFKEGIAKVEKDDLWGCVDKTGKIVVPIEYNDIRSYNGGFIALYKNDRCGLVKLIKESDDDFNEIIWDKNVTNNAKKDWTIKFNKAIDENYATSEYIYIKNSQGIIIPTNLQLSQDKKSAIISPSQEFSGYIKGEEYYLYISDVVKSLSGDSLQKSIKMPFIYE